MTIACAKIMARKVLTVVVRTENAVCRQVMCTPGGCAAFLLAGEKRLSWRRDPPDVLQAYM
jgi:hypothetical protein